MKDKPSLEEILSQALEISDPAELNSYLDKVCSGDDGKRAEVQSLLSAHLEAEGFMETRNELDWGSLLEGQEEDSMPTADELAEDFPELEIIELIGRGGMGAVFKARQASLDRFVALKVLPSNWNRTGEFADRFEREAKILAGLNHPGIVTIHEFGERRGRYFFTMEFVDGTDLGRMIRGGDYEPEEALKLISQICEAIQFAHDRGVVHRDIKPGNILLSRDGRVKVADFGIAKLGVNSEEIDASENKGDQHQDLTAPDGIVGTPRYMAPEQASASTSVDHRADLYALGMVFYEMLIGSPPAEGALPLQTSKLDRRWDQIIERALEKDPEKRYQNASEIRTAVESVLAVQENRVPTWLKAVAVMAALVVVLALWPKTKPEEERPVVNSLEMEFVPVSGVDGLVSKWETRVRDYQVFVEETGRTWKPPVFEQTPEHPAVNVSWHDAMAFCQWLTVREHEAGLLPEDEVYRLPTDLEWSAMAGLTGEEGSNPKERHLGQETIYPWGEEALVPEGAGNFPDATGQEKLNTAAIPGYTDGFGATAPVGGFQATTAGLYDLGGNVWEWTSQFNTSEDGHPVLRGGGWHAWEADDGWKSLLASYRRADIEASESREWDVGFRMVRGPKSSETGDLFNLILRGSLDEIEEAIAGGADVKKRNKAGQPPLVLAADTGDFEKVKILKQHGASIQSSDRRGRTALHAAAELGNTEIVAWLLKEGADPKSRTISRQEPMMLAVRRAPVELLELLLAAAGPESLIREDKIQQSAVTEACFNAPDETMRWVIQQLDSKLIEEAGVNTVSMWVVHLMKRDQSFLGDLLVKAAGHLDESETFFLLTSAIQFDREEDFSLLMEVFDEDGLSPEILSKIGMVAVRLGRPWAIKKYLSMGGDLSDLDFGYGRRALHFAARDNRISREDVKTNLEKEGMSFKDAWARKHLDRDLAYMTGPAIRETIQTLVGAEADLEVRDDSGATPLITAAMNGNLAAVETLLGLGAKTEAVDQSGFTPLLCAVEKGHLGIIRELERKGADFSVTNKKEQGVVHLVYRHEEVLQYLLDKELPLEEKDQYGNTPLISLATSGDDGIIRRLLEAGADVNATTGSKGLGGTTALHVASRVRDDEVAERQLERQGALGGDKEYLVEHADREERIRTIKLLVDAGANPMARESNGMTPLHLAAGFGLHEAVEYFLKNGGMVNSITNQLNAPVHQAAEGGHLECVKVLVEGGAELDVPEWLYPVISSAISGGNAEVVSYLLAKGVPFDLPASGTGMQPIHLAADRGEVEMLVALVKAGAKVDARDNFGVTPLHRAAGRGHRKVVDLLASLGARINAVDQQGGTPANYAGSEGHNALAAHLRSLSN